MTKNLTILYEKIIVAGATGNLGGKIIKALLTKTSSASNCPFRNRYKKKDLEQKVSSLSGGHKQ
jgi:N-acetyl-gamma-glutamylphosphate reductase